MNEAVVVLALVWVVVLLPGAIRARRTSLHATVGGFERAMDVLRPPGDRVVPGRRLMVPEHADRIVGNGHDDRPAPEQWIGREDPLIARRRTAFTRLLMASGITLVAAVFLGGALWPLLLVMLAGTGGYAALLRHVKLQRDEARRVVRDLAPERLSRQRGFNDLDAMPASRAVGDGWGAPHGGPQVATGPDDPWEPQAGVRIRHWPDAGPHDA